MQTTIQPWDARVKGIQLFFLPVSTRVPLKFGGETLTSVTCARACVTLTCEDGRSAEGWGETPLSVQWVWPSTLSYAAREDALKNITGELAEAWVAHDFAGHPVDLCYRFGRDVLPGVVHRFNNTSGKTEPVPHLAALVAASALDIATHDAYGKLHDTDAFATLDAKHIRHTLTEMIQPADGSDIDFIGRHINDYLLDDPPTTLCAWHLVGGLDALTDDDRTGDEPDDGYPVTLQQWIQTDGVTALKIKLRGNDADWDYDRLVRVGRLALPRGVEALTADFNCTVTDPVEVRRVIRHDVYLGLVRGARSLQVWSHLENRPNSCDADAE